MKTTSTVTNKCHCHYTQKAPFPLCALPLDTPRRANANFRKIDITKLQVDAIVNTKLTKGQRLSAKYVIHIAAPVWHGGTEGDADLLFSCYRHFLGMAERVGVKAVALPAIGLVVQLLHNERYDGSLFIDNHKVGGGSYAEVHGISRNAGLLSPIFGAQSCKSFS